MCSAVASALFIAPTANHRIEFRKRDKEHLVLVSNWLALAGTAFLALAMTGVVLLVTDVMFGAATTVVATIAIALLFLVLWYAVPLQRLRSRGQTPG